MEPSVKNLLDGLPFGVALVDDSGRVVCANRDSAGFLEATMEMLAGKDSSKVDSGRPAVDCQLQDAIRVGQLVEAEYHDERRNRWFIRTICPLSLVTRDGSPCYLQVFRDVTDTKKLDALLHEREAILARVQQLAHIGDWQYDPGTKMQTWSAEMYRILDLNPELGPPSCTEYDQLVHPGDQARLCSASRDAIGEGKGFDLELRIVRRDGEVRDVTVVCEPQLDSMNRPLRLAGTLRDITARKQAWMASRASEEAYRLIFDSAPVGIVVATPHGEILAANHYALEMAGYSLAEMQKIGTPGLYAVPHDIEQRLEALRKSGRSQEREMLLRRKDGSTLTALVSMRQIMERTQPVILTVMRDITERKQAEELRESEERYRSIAKDSFDVMFRLDAEGKMTFVSSVVETLYGLRVSEFQGLPFTRIFTPDAIPRVERLLAEVREGRTIECVELSIFRKEGDTSFVVASAAPLLEDGRVTGVQGVLRNVSGCRMAAQSLRDSEERYRLLFENIGVGLLIAGLDGTIIVANRAAAEVLGYALPELIGLNVEVICRNPKDRFRLVEAVRCQGLASDFRVELTRRDGSPIAANLRTTPHQLRDRDVLLTALLDVTARTEEGGAR